jgi:hypothetical protein
MRTVFVILFFLFNISYGHAAHVFGTDLSYTCLGNNQYEVILTLYRECGGVAAPNTADINISSFSCNQSLLAVTLQIDTALSGFMITPLCSSFAASSSCNGGGLPGEDIIVYKGIVTLSTECPDWKVSFAFGVRSSYYTNLISPSSDNIYIEALIDNSFGNCYDSPVFRGHSMLYACAGQFFSHDMGAIDWDGDTLKYTLLTPMASATQTAAFQGGLSSNNPLVLLGGTSFDLNNRTGEISFTSQVGLNQFAAVSIRVDKWHGGKIVASTMGEMDIAINASCANASIVHVATTSESSGWYYNDTLQAFISCSESTNPFLFKTVFYDLNGDVIQFGLSDLDTVFGVANWTYFANASSPFGTDSVEYLIQVLPTLNPLPPAANSQVSFSIGATDDNCPYNSNRIMTYLAFPAFIKAATSKTVLCEGSPQIVQLSMSGTHLPSNIQWTQIANGAPMVSPSNFNISNPILVVPALSAGVTLVYEVTATVDSCSVMDTISLYIVDTPNITLQVTNTSSLGSTDGAATISATGNLAQFNYQWETGVSSTAINNLAVGNYWVTATDYYGCQSVDTAIISFGTNIQTISKLRPPFKIYPNPTDGKNIQIELDVPTESILFSVYNSLGQVVPIYQVSLSVGEKNYRLDLNQQIPGVYWLQIQIGNRSYTQKVVLN